MNNKDGNREETGEETCEKCDVLKNEMIQLRESVEKRINETMEKHDEELKRMQALHTKQKADLEKQKEELEKKVLFYKRKMEESDTKAKRQKEEINSHPKQTSASTSSPVSVVAQAFTCIAGKHILRNIWSP